ncbi:hypothetical protein [Spirillospora albida]|uniref:hypothetical protein n=1 Tax=Spirillospora albida TaxID=58123 RepID=UPI00068AAC52|nr:hypothetical protein [Spirillospora albida]
MPFPRRRADRRRRHRETAPGHGAPPPVLPDRAAPPLRIVTGTLLDASPHLLIVATASGEERLTMTEATTVWHGGRGGPAALRPGREVIVRPRTDGFGADRVWVDIGRVTGTMLACGRDTVEVDMGPHRGRAHVAVPPQVLEPLLVRHPRMEPGYLIDVICVGSPDGPRAVRPGTPQPGHRADDLAAPDPAAPVPPVLHGTVTWWGGASAPPPRRRGLYEDTWPYTADVLPPRARLAQLAPPPVTGREAHESLLSLLDTGDVPGPGWDERAEAEESPTWREFPLLTDGGAAYPAVDAETGGGCADAPSGCVPFPALSLGSEITVHNRCGLRTATAIVVECGCVAARYCDRCVECGVSPRGRLAELTPAAFAALGGDLETGCFNALVRPDVGGSLMRGSAVRW